MRWTGGRHDTFEFLRLTRSGDPAGTFDHVTHGEISENSNTSLKVSGFLDVVGDADPGNSLVRVIFRAVEDSETAEVTLGTFFAATPSRVHTDAGTTARIELYSMLLALDEDRLERTLTVASGSDVVSAARQLAVDAGLRVTAAPSAHVSGAALVFEAGTTRLEAVNALLDHAGYASAAVGVDGVVRMFPYVPPASRPLEWTFTDGDGSMFLPEVPVEVDWYHAPNVVVVTSTGATATLTAIAVNDDPASPLSTVTRGRRIVRYERVSDAAGQEALQAKADRLLASSSRKVTTGTLRHTYAPLSLGGRVRLAYAAAGIDYAMTVQSRDMELVPGLPTTTKVRRFDV